MLKAHSWSSVGGLADGHTVWAPQTKWEEEQVLWQEDDFFVSTGCSHYPEDSNNTINSRTSVKNNWYCTHSGGRIAIENNPRIMPGQNSVEDMMDGYQPISQSCMDISTLSLMSRSGAGQIRNDQLYSSSLDDAEREKVSRAHSVGDVSTGLTLSLVGQKKADSMLNLAYMPMQKGKESSETRSIPHEENNGNIEEESGMLTTKHTTRTDSGTVLTSFSTSRVKSPVRGKRSLPHVPVSEASQRIKRFTELMNARMALHSSSSHNTVASLTPDEECAITNTTSLAQSDSEMSDVCYGKVMIRGNSNKMYRCNKELDDRTADKLSETSSPKNQSIGQGGYPRDHHNSLYFQNATTEQGYVSRTNSQFTNYVSKSHSDFHEPTDSIGDPKCHVTTSQLTHYQKMIAALNTNQQNSSDLKNLNRYNIKHSRNLSDFSTFQTKQAIYNLNMDKHLSVQVGPTSNNIESVRDEERPFCEKNKTVNANAVNKWHYGSQPNLTFSQSSVRHSSRGHLQPCGLKPAHFRHPNLSGRSHEGPISSYDVTQPQQHSPRATNGVVQNSVPSKTRQIAGNNELITQALKYSTLPGNWKQNTDERRLCVTPTKRHPTLYQLSHHYTFHGSRLRLPAGQPLHHCLSLCIRVLDLPALREVSTEDYSATSSPQGHYTPNLGGPGSAFRPVLRSLASTSVTFVAVEQIKADRMASTYNLAKGDLIVEMNGYLFLGVDSVLVKKTMEVTQGEIFLTIARLKNVSMSPTMDQMMNEIDFLRAEIAQRDSRIKDLQTQLEFNVCTDRRQTCQEDSIPNEEVEMSEDEFIV